MRLFGVMEAARELGVNASEIRRALRSGILDSYDVCGGRPILTKEQLEALADAIFGEDVVEEEEE